MDSFRIRVDFEKSQAPTGQYVRGWASVVSKDGESVVDHEGDMIEMDELRQAAHGFVVDSRAGQLYHRDGQIGEVVESVVIDDEFAAATGMSDPRRGWWIGMRINDPAVRARVASGELRAFSIGGSAVRTEADGEGE